MADWTGWDWFWKEYMDFGNVLHDLWVAGLAQVIHNGDGYMMPPLTYSEMIGTLSGFPMLKMGVKIVLAIYISFALSLGRTHQLHATDLTQSLDR